MPYKDTFKLLFVILFGCVITSFDITLVQAQSSPREKPQLKDFGSSIKPKKDSEQSKNQTENRNNPSEDNDVIKIETRLVRTDVLVVDQRGKAIVGLKAEDFIITENDVTQEIGTFSLGESVDVPKSIVLIIDYSYSQVPFIKNSVEAAKVLVDKLNPKDRMAIVTDDVELIQEFTNNKNRLKNKLDSLRKNAERFAKEKDPTFLVKPGRVGKSRQFSALMATLNELFDDEDVRPMIIFQTDGDEAFSISRPASQNNNSKEVSVTNFTVNDLFNRIEKSRATIYSVVSGHSMLGLSEDERIAKYTEILEEQIKERKNKYPNFKFTIGDRESIKNYTERRLREQTAMMIVARSSGGFTENLETPEQADAVYMKILNDINNRYLLGYYPKNEERDGKRRRVKIEVKGHPEYIVWGRKTYLAPEAEK